ncbi:MAG: hypothetical protein NDJ18_09450 [candidate division Zixibacteria bacterium]|nr:hypothetical protein [candidate division Zixibacteria bacterium]
MKKSFWPILTLLILTIISILLHATWCGTPMASSETRWQEIVEYHRTFYPFSIRYFTTYLVLGINQLTGLPLRETFFALQYLLMGAAALLFNTFLHRVGFNRGWSLAGMALFLASFPVIFAHSEPVFTWDDGWTYLYLLLATISLINRSLWPAVVCFTLGCFAREQMLLYFPVLVLGVDLFCTGESRRRKLIALLFPLLIYGAFYFATYQSPDQKRFELLAYNFESGPASTNSLFSVFISFGAVWVAWIIGLRKRIDLGQGDGSGALNKFLRWSSIFAVVPTLLVGLLFASARETRIFFPPFLFVIPVALGWLRSQAKLIESAALKRRRLMVVTMLSLVAIALAMILTIRPDLDYRNCPDFCYLWGGIHLGLSAGLMAVALLSGGDSKRSARITS